MKKILTYLVLLSGTIFVLLNGNQKAQASQLNFNVEAIIPENQVDKIKHIMIYELNQVRCKT